MSEEAMAYLLRVEAVNLCNFVYDTNKIQPMRGGGFLLLDSVQKLAEEDSNKSKPSFSGVSLEKITTGASIGLFSFNASHDDAQKVADAVLENLNKATQNHATFVIDWVPSGGNETFKEDLALLEAKNRWRQYQQPTLVIPMPNQSLAECEIDGVRPAGSNKLKSSESVYFRTVEGSKLRQRIYNRILKPDNCDHEFTDDLHELSSDKTKENLNDKIAFIYLDGNKFGKIKSLKCSTASQLTDFSNLVESVRRTFLGSLLSQTASDSDFKTNDRIRLETLLWGGDELEIIVPAWKGWQVLQELYKHLGTASFDGIDLTHAGGVVFCNCKAPILQVRAMAHALAEIVKDAVAFKDDFENIENISHDKHNAFHALVLESFDTISTDVTTFADSWYGKGTFDLLRITPEKMITIENAIKTMKEKQFPRNKIFDIVKAAKSGLDVKTCLDRALDGLEGQDEIREKIDLCCCGENKRWFLISEFWDYVGRNA